LLTKCSLLAAVLSGCEFNNKYVLKNSMGQDFLKAKEDTDCCTRQCCGPARPFEMILEDIQGQEIIHLSRPLRCNSWCCPESWLQSIDISAPPGNPIGSIHQEWSFCTPFAGKFVVQNTSGDTVLRIHGPTCPCSCGSDVVFEVLSQDGAVKVGTITKQWRGFCAEAFTDTDNFGITFPLDMEVKSKALLIGAMFLIVSHKIEFVLGIHTYTHISVLKYKKTSNRERDINCL
ncbi:Phospholipid scramblase 3, partial [Halocaridina rubra]